MNTPAHTLIIDYPGLQPGGIEVYLSKLMKYALDQNDRVIWLTSPSGAENAFYKDVTEDPRVERVYVRQGWHWDPIRIAFQKDERVTMISCEPLYFLKSESIRETADVASFHHFLLLPHFTGNAYYPERFFRSKPVRRHWHRVMTRVAEAMVERGCIRAFSQQHLTAYEENYGVTIPDKPAKGLKGIKELDPFSEEAALRKAKERAEEFRIVTCARFDFPHKGYILGLVDSFAALKKNHPQLKLVIVGYGLDENRLREKIAALPPEVSADITLTGALTLEQMKEEFYKGHLNVGLAGALFDGAACGIPSLLTRHYCEACETYGFIDGIEGNFLRNDPAEDVTVYVEQTLRMSDEEYVAHCRSSYGCVQERRSCHPEYLFEQAELAQGPLVSPALFRKCKRLNFLCHVQRRYFKVPGYEN